MGLTVPSDSPAVLEALRLLSLDSVPEVHWIHGDSECDCLFQRIGDWNNPYIGRTLRVRVCCIWAELYKQYPQFVQEMPYYDPHTHSYTNEPAEWDSGEMDMPLGLWHRQLAIREGKSIAQIRAEYAGREKERPKKGPRRSNEPDANVLRRAEEARMKLAGILLEDESL